MKKPMSNSDQIHHAHRMHERVKTLGYNYNHPSFKRPRPKRVGMKDTMFGCYQASPWLLWVFRNRAWVDEPSRRKVLRTLWEKRREWYQMLDGMKPSVREEYMDVLYFDIYMKPEYKQENYLYEAKPL